MTACLASKFPDLLFEPFYGLSSASIVLTGEEDLKSELVWRFDVAETERHRRMILWVGATDGLVRRWQEFDWLGETVESEFEFSQVRVDPPLDAAAFRIAKDSGYQEQQLDTIMDEGMAQMAKAMNMPPEDIFQEFFDSPLSEVQELQGAGGAFLGYDLWVRFRSSQPPVLKKSETYGKGGAEPAIAWFARGFPEDRRVLEDHAQLTFLERRSSGSDASSGAWFLSCPSTGLFFFRAWQGN